MIIITINYRVTTVTTVCVLGTADKCLDILPFVDWAYGYRASNLYKRNNDFSIINVLVNTWIHPRVKSINHERRITQRFTGKLAKLIFVCDRIHITH